LSHNQVNSFIRDNQGFLWVATGDGLCRYDGYTFKIFKHNPDDSNSLSGNVITDLFIDHQGKIWINAGKNLNVYDPVYDKITRCSYVLSEKIPYVGENRSFFDYDKNHNIWYANESSGLYKYYPK